MYYSGGALNSSNNLELFELYEIVVLLYFKEGKSKYTTKSIKSMLQCV